MAESTSGLLRTHPLEAWAEAFARLPESIAVTALPFVAMVDVRLAAPSERLGIDLPTVPNTWVPTPGRARRLARSRRVAAHQRTRAAGGPGGADPRCRRPARRGGRGRLRAADRDPADRVAGA
jgi:hypothetical protein